MGRIGRSFQLVGQSYRLLMQDKELMLLPLFSGIIMAVVVGTFALALGVNATMLETRTPELYVPLFFMYVASTRSASSFSVPSLRAPPSGCAGGSDGHVRAAAASRRIVAIVIWALLRPLWGRAAGDSRPCRFLGKLSSDSSAQPGRSPRFSSVPVLVLEDSTSATCWRARGSLQGDVGRDLRGQRNLGLAAFCAWMVLAPATRLLASASACRPCCCSAVARSC